VVHLAVRPHFYACLYGDTVAAAPQPFGLGKPAVCGSQSLVTSIFGCRFGD